MLDSAGPVGTSEANAMRVSTRAQTAYTRPKRTSFRAAAKDRRSWRYPLTMFGVGCGLVALMDRNVLMLLLVAFACGSAYLSNIISVATRAK